MQTKTVQIITLVYYLILMLVLVSWTNINSLPPLILRLLFMFAVLLPLWYQRNPLFVQIFLTFIVVSASSYAVSYMPVDGLYILMSIVTSIIIMQRSHRGSLTIPYGFIVLTLLSFMIDFIYSQKITISFSWLSIVLIALFLLKKDSPNQVSYIAFSFSIIALILSIEFIAVGDRFVRDVSTIVGNIDRKGWADPNYFGAILGMGIITIIIEFLTNKIINKKQKIYYIFCIILALYTLFTTASRGAVIALLGSVIILLLFSSIKWKAKIGMFVGGIIILFITYYLHILDLLILRFMSDAGDAGGRTEIWSTRLMYFFNECSPLQWLFGVGAEKSITLGTGRVLGFHNDFISVLVRYGIIGLLALLGMLISPVIYTKKKKRGIVLAATTYLVIYMSTIEPFTGGQWGCLYFYLYILMLSQSKYNYNENQI